MKRFLCGVFSLFFLLLCGCATEQPTASSGAVQGDTRATLCAVGDIYFPENILKTLKSEDDYIALFGDTVNTVAAADLAIGNFEGNFAGTPYTGGSYPDEAAAALANAGFDLLQTANSFSIENGLTGLARTKAVIEGEQLTALGTYTSQADANANRVVVREVNGIRIAFVAFTKGLGSMSIPAGSEYCVNLLYTDYSGNYSRVDTAGITAVLEQAQQLQPDIIVTALHWGSEDSAEVSKTQTEIADLLLKNGVDVILGSHTHRVGPLERRTVYSAAGTEKEAVIAYGLGDYCAVEEGGVRAGLMLNLEFTKDGSTGLTTVTGVSYVPIATADLGADAKRHYEVLNMDNAIALYESNYYARVSDELYQMLVSRREKLEEALFPTAE